MEQRFSGKNENPFEMEKIGDLAPEKLFEYIHNIKDPEEAKRIVGEEKYEEYLEYIKEKKSEERFGKIQDKRDSEKEWLETLQEDREDRQSPYRNPEDF